MIYNCLTEQKAIRKEATMKKPTSIVRKNKDAMNWITEKTGIDDPALHYASSFAELKKFINISNDNITPLVVITKSRTGTKWWNELIGPNNPNVYFLTSKESQTSGQENFAIVLFNISTMVVNLDDFKKWDTPELINKLHQLGLSDTDISEKVHASNAMTINRAKDENKHFNNRINLIKNLMNVLNNEISVEHMN